MFPTRVGKIRLVENDISFERVNLESRKLTTSMMHTVAASRGLPHTGWS